MSVLLPVMLFLEKDYLIQQLLQKIQSEKRFKQKEQYYRKNRFNYKIVQNNEFLTYIETCNDKIIKNHSFSIYSLEYKILKFANDKVVTISDLNKLHGNKYSYLDIMNVINNLTKLQILYFSHIYNELISIIELES